MRNYILMPYKYSYHNIVIIYNKKPLYKNNTFQSNTSLYYVKFYRNNHDLHTVVYKQYKSNIINNSAFIIFGSISKT